MLAKITRESFQLGQKYEHVKNMNYQLMQTVKKKQSKKRVQANYKDLGASISSEKPQENIG